MNNDNRRNFEFASWSSRASEMTEHVRAFAAHHALRSAAVEELVLDDEFHRRALRPEDLSFIDFSRPVETATVTRLGFLAAQRTLLSIHELKVAGLPVDGSAESFARVAEFYEDEQQLRGQRIAPFLESFAFDFLERSALAETRSRQGLSELLLSVLRDEAAFWRRALSLFESSGYLEEGLRFALIQTWCLSASKRAALSQAHGARFFEPLGAEAMPHGIGRSELDGLVREVALRCGLERKQHSYWQFYLSTSLASANLLHAYARRPDRALSLYGAAFVAEAEWSALGCLVGGAAVRLDMTRAMGSLDALVDPSEAKFVARFQRMLDVVEHKWGERGLRAVASGLTSAAELGRAARRNLGEQLRWLCSIDKHRAFAERLERRIQAERPNIDRETFVEPREMCSTMHVHDDHRLVSIESGNMVFWGNVGMLLRLAPGERVLVPQGRLHGSSIESPECTYHQPIIPEEWITPLFEELGVGAEL